MFDDAQGVVFDGHVAFGGGGYADDGKNDQCDDDTGERSPQHVTDVFVKVGAGHGGCKVCCVGKGGELIPEIGTADDCACGNTHGHSHAVGNPDQPDSVPTVVHELPILADMMAVTMTTVG